jgi:feruloyl esterase
VHRKPRIAPAWFLAVALPAAPAALAAPATLAAPGPAARCAALPDLMQGAWPDSSTRVVAVRWVDEGPQPAQVLGETTSVMVPAHCELTGAVQDRIGEGGQHYAIRFHLRLPGGWNGRFFFQGGGGSNGVLGDALGNYSAAAKPALAQGFAVVSQDSGHDNATNDDPARGGVLVFGFDPQARANYGYASLPVVARAAKAALKRYYGRAPRRSYFVGCSKGGEEGMALSQRDPGEFDGIAANSPGMSLPRAAVSQAWDTQTLASLVRGPSDPLPPFARLALAFSDADFGLVRDAVLAACDSDDGLKDGVVGDFTRCTAARVAPELARRRCSAGKAAGCLGAGQIEALGRMMSGPHDAAGNALYSDWPWDAGLGQPNWRLWKMGNPNGSPPALNVALGGASLASDFTTPPTPMSADPQALFEFVMAFDFDRDAPRIYATNAQFPHSAWQDIAARSADLERFRGRGAKMIVVHGVSDPVFSINDTLAWWNEVDRAAHGRAAAFVRVFPVPGMNHCGGGDATDQYDVLAPLTRWVEEGQAPDSIPAGSRPRAVHAGRSRPLCPYPKVARYSGGDPESAGSFRCSANRP